MTDTRTVLVVDDSRVSRSMARQFILSKQLAGMLHRPLDLIARYGGEEFAVILPDIGEVQARQLAESMRLCVGQLQIPHAPSTGAAHVTVSIGMATRTARNHAETAALIGAADRALYAAKRAGRNRMAIETIE